jgi:hypothetical protein
VTKGRDAFSGAAEVIKPYLERAVGDQRLRDDVSRVATADVRERLRETLEDIRGAGTRLPGRRERSSGRASAVLVAGVALGILFNPLTGPGTRRFIRDLLSAGDDGRKVAGSNGHA